MNDLPLNFKETVAEHVETMFPTLSGEDQVRLQNLLLSLSDHIQAQDLEVKGARRLNTILLGRLGGHVRVAEAEILALPEANRLFSRKDPLTGEVDVWVTSPSKH